MWSDQELEDFKAFIAENPLEGDVIAGAGGFRKVRWARSGSGKRGGARVIYFYYDPGHPLLLAMFYAKASKSDLTPAERKGLHDLAADMKRTFRKERR